MTDPNITVYDQRFKDFKGTREKVEFLTKEDAEDYIENHERPNDLYVIFDKHFVQRSLDNFKKEFNLTEDDFEVLNLIDLKNSVSSIEKYLNKNIMQNILRLERNSLIKKHCYSVEITEKGKQILGEREVENGEEEKSRVVEKRK